MASSNAVFEKQGIHAAGLAILLAVLIYVFPRFDELRAGAALGAGTPFWFWFAVAVAIVHQVYVWLCWRTQLHGALLTRRFGALAFPLYARGFTLLGVTRILSVFILAYANRGSLPADGNLMKLLGLVALVPAAYLFYSVRRYFGFERAFGIDHFDERYRSMPFVRGGIFRFTPNAMYVFGFLILWAPALWYASAAALAAALFNHVYIWIHYYATELPDIRRIYAGRPGRETP